MPVYGAHAGGAAGESHHLGHRRRALNGQRPAGVRPSGRELRQRQNNPTVCSGLRATHSLRSLALVSHPPRTPGRCVARGTATKICHRLTVCFLPHPGASHRTKHYHSDKRASHRFLSSLSLTARGATDDPPPAATLKSAAPLTAYAERDGCRQSAPERHGDAISCQRRRPSWPAGAGLLG